MRKIARLSDKERAELFRNTADRIKLHDAVVEKISVVCLICLKFFQIIIFGKSSISAFMVSGAILTFARFLKIGRSWSGVWGFHHQAICTPIRSTKSMLATPSGQ